MVGCVKDKQASPPGHLMSVDALCHIEQEPVGSFILQLSQLASGQGLHLVWPWAPTGRAVPFSCSQLTVKTDPQCRRVSALIHWKAAVFSSYFNANWIDLVELETVTWKLAWSKSWTFVVLHSLRAAFHFGLLMWNSTFVKVSASTEYDATNSWPISVDFLFPDSLRLTYVPNDCSN